MKNTHFSASFYEDCQTAPVIRVKSNWIAMSVGFFGWVILLIAAVGLYFLSNRYLRFYDDFVEPGLWAYILVAVHAFIFGIGFYVIFDKYFPRQWITEATINFDEKTIAIKSRGETRVLPFSRISKGIYQGASPIFTSHYMYWVEVEGERIPLVSFTNEPASFVFYNMLERRVGLKMEQEPGN